MTRIETVEVVTEEGRKNEISEKLKEERTDVEEDPFTFRAHPKHLRHLSQDT